MFPQELSRYSDADFQRLTGVSRKVFSLMLSEVQQYESLYHSGKGRKSKISLDNQLLLTLLYWKQYGGLLLYSYIYHVDTTTVFRITEKIKDILHASGQFNLPETALSEVTEHLCLVDATEVEIQRPVEHQEDVYSGKKKSTPLSFK